MINIEEEVFIENLRLTQAYCRLQMQGGPKSNAELFRNYNPFDKGSEQFEFQTKNFEFDVAPGINHFISTKWAIDPTEDETIIDTLFKGQILFKESQLSTFNDNLYPGKILICQVDSIIPDGVSEAESLGFIDQYDIPPIDTWFYIAHHKYGRLLFAWIPDKFLQVANEAIAVNMIDCIGWFDTMLPEEYDWLKPAFRKLISNNL